MLWGATDNENKGPRVPVHCYTLYPWCLLFLPEALSWRKAALRPRALNMSVRAPPALSHLQPYLDRAEELRPASVTVAYHLRVLAASAGLPHSGVAAAKTFLLDLLDAIEAERGVARPAPTDDQAIRRFALDLFHRARNSDKPDVLPSPHADWAVLEAPRVAQCYHASAVVFDAARQYAPLPDEEARLQRYAFLRSSQEG